MVDELTSLPNIGPVLAQKLRQAGIESYGDLADLGSVEAYLRIWDHDGVVLYGSLEPSVEWTFAGPTHLELNFRKRTEQDMKGEKGVS